MAAKNEWVYAPDKQSIVLPNGKPTRTKKLTGTRFAAALGFNQWKSPFQVWCEVTKVAEPPFEGNKFTEAGIAIEPKLLAFVVDELDATVLSPEDYWGSLYPERKYDFFPETPVFGGMWDGLELDAAGKPRTIIECKTTQAKNAKDWVDSPPAYYLAQALLYAALQDVPRVIFAVSFLEPGEYAHPENFVCDDDNSRFWFFDVATTVITLEGRDYDIHGLIDLASRWWTAHVESAESPEFDETRDAEYLKILRTANPAADSDLEGLLATIDTTEGAIAALRAQTGLDAMEKELKAAKDALKVELMKQLSDTVDYVDAGVWRLSRTQSLDTNALKEAGLYEKYLTDSTRLGKKPKSEQ